MPTKRKRFYNTSGLQNQGNNSAQSSPAAAGALSANQEEDQVEDQDGNRPGHSGLGAEFAGQDGSGEDEDEDGDEADAVPGLIYDSLRIDLALEEEEEGMMDDQDQYMVEWGVDNGQDEFGADGLQEALVDFAYDHGDSVDDEEWLPADIKAQKKRRKAEQKDRPPEYKSFFTSSAEQTVRRRNALMRDQTFLHSWIKCKPIPEVAEDVVENVGTGFDGNNVEDSVIVSGSGLANDLAADGDDESHRDDDEDEDGAVRCVSEELARMSVAQPVGDDVLSEEDYLEAWEDELAEVSQEKAEVRPWSQLRTQIKEDLEHKYKSLLPREINQLMILQNFATLQIKGMGIMEASRVAALQWSEGEGSGGYFAQRIRSLARHYQCFEQLPPEQRGGSKNAQSLLNDETVQSAARGWLSLQKIGTLTPLRFAEGLKKDILPSVGILLASPLCDQTARRWLARLGWARVTL